MIISFVDVVWINHKKRPVLVCGDCLPLTPVVEIDLCEQYTQGHQFCWCWYECLLLTLAYPVVKMYLCEQVNVDIGMNVYYWLRSTFNPVIDLCIYGRCWVDCVMMWWTEWKLCVSGVECPTPKAVLTGHQAEVSCLAVIAELGIVVSGSKGQFFSFLFCVGFS